jgi:adenylosuccinate synthase
MIEHFINDVAFMCKHITWVYDDVLNTYDNIVFENGQGLLLDQNRTEYGDNTTPSNTGIKNPHEIIRKHLPDADVEVCYVTRTYLTRHGAGKFEEECDKSEINAKMEDKTNVPNPYQGSIRYGKLDVSSLLNRIQNDIDSVEGCNYNISLAITHLNEYENKILLSQNRFEKVYLSNNETRKMKRRTTIDKNKFIRYVKVQASGVCNMWSSEVQDRAGLTKEEHMDIIKNYDVYEKEFDVHVEDYM